MKKGILENFAKFTGKHLWFAKFSKTRFLQNTSGRLLLLLALQKQPPEVLYAKFRKIHRKTPLVCEIFTYLVLQKHLFLWNISGRLLLAFSHFFFLSVSKNNQVLGILEWQKTIFNDSFDLIIFIFQQGKRLMMERDFLAEVV